MPRGGFRGARFASGLARTPPPAAHRFPHFYGSFSSGARAWLGGASAPPLVSRQAHAPKPRLRVKHGLARIFKCRNLGCIPHKKREFCNSLKLCIRLDAAALSAFVKVRNGFIEIVRVVSVIPKVISVFFLR